MPPNGTDATNTTNGSAAGGGPLAKPDGAPELPDAVPDGVQQLLDGIFSVGGSIAGGIGDLVSGLAEAIGGGTGETGMVVASHALDLAGVVL